MPQREAYGNAGWALHRATAPRSRPRAPFFRTGWYGPWGHPDAPRDGPDRSELATAPRRRGLRGRSRPAPCPRPLPRAPAASTPHHRQHPCRTGSAPFREVRRGAHRGGRRARGSAPERDRIRRTQPLIFSQLHICAETLAIRPAFASATCQEETARYAFTRHGRAMIAARTSLCRSRVERFVIERFTPSCLVDIVPVGERVISGRSDAVDSILKIEDWGLVQDRGDTCRSDRPVGTRETRTPRGA